MAKKNRSALEQLIAYFPYYDNETLARFIRSNDIMLKIWREHIAETLHENEVIRQEIERRNRETNVAG